MTSFCDNVRSVCAKHIYCIIPAWIYGNPKITTEWPDCKIYSSWLKATFRKGKYLHFICSLFSNIGHYLSHWSSQIILILPYVVSVPDLCIISMISTMWRSIGLSGAWIANTASTTTCQQNISMLMRMLILQLLLHNIHQPYPTLSSVLAELWCKKRACGAPWVSKSTHPGKFGNHVTVHRPPIHTNVYSHTF